MKRFLITMAVSLVALTACATGPRLSDEQQLALYRQHAGEPVDSFHYFRSLNGWRPLGDSALAVWTRPNQAYLLELVGSCPDLEFTPAISVSNQFGRVYSGFDEVTVLQPHSHNFPCRIDEIRPIDVQALEQAEQDLREQVEMVERAAQSADGSDGGT